jgi:lipopolysaccharide/colanic/teichoic acid biosynthesis glycosyltransferase
MSRIVTLSAVAVTLGAWAGAVQHVLSVTNVTLEQQHLVSPARRAPASVLVGRGGRFFKRCVDVTTALLVGIPTLPLLGALLVMIRLDSPGPSVYSCQRVGTGGRPFKCYKVRSMYSDAEARLEECLAADPKLREEYARYRKLRRDPRITRAGKILRRYSLDELLQLWNVLKGDMSIVGPRPYESVEVPLMAGAERVIHAMKPGITGLWQVSGRNHLNFDNRIRLDVRYVQEWSVSLDLKILVRTIPVVLSGTGAY